MDVWQRVTAAARVHSAQTEGDAESGREENEHKYAQILSSSEGHYEVSLIITHELAIKLPTKFKPCEVQGKQYVLFRAVPDKVFPFTVGYRFHISICRCGMKVCIS